MYSTLRTLVHIHCRTHVLRTRTRKWKAFTLAALATQSADRAYWSWADAPAAHQLEAESVASGAERECRLQRTRTARRTAADWRAFDEWRIVRANRLASGERILLFSPMIQHRGRVAKQLQSTSSRLQYCSTRWLECCTLYSVLCTLHSARGPKYSY